MSIMAWATAHPIPPIVFIVLAGLILGAYSLHASKNKSRALAAVIIGCGMGAILWGVLTNLYITQASSSAIRWQDSCQ